MKLIEGQRFEGQIFTIDDTEIKDSVFIDCELIYHGGKFKSERLTITRCRVQFVGAASNTLQVLDALGFKVGGTNAISSEVK